MGRTLIFFMAITPTDIANRALARLGQAQITDLAANTVVPTYCRTAYEPVRLQLLRSHPWNFAIRREPLGLFTSDSRFGPKRAFFLPPGYISTVAAWADINGCAKIDKYSIEGEFFVTWEEQVYLLYVQDMADPTLWDSVFQEAVVLTLASRIAKQITGDAAQAQALLSEVEQLVMPKAMLYDARDDTSNENSPVCDFINTATINRVHQSLGYGYSGLPNGLFDISSVNTTF